MVLFLLGLFDLSKLKSEILESMMSVSNSLLRALAAIPSCGLVHVHLVKARLAYGYFPQKIMQCFYFAERWPRIFATLYLLELGIGRKEAGIRTRSLIGSGNR